ncbi:ATP-dependent Clp protease proteolytic subunit [Haloactinopolyspora alba]|nr:ATP-dependent Clp protease proteolytic subunit [Haloactinopolyspora alba]
MIHTTPFGGPPAGQEIPPPSHPRPPWHPSPHQPEPPAPGPTVPSWEEAVPAPPGDDLTDRLLQQRIVYLGGVLDTALANRGASQLLLLDRRDDAPIELHLTCRDSELDASLALADTVETVSATVSVFMHGTVCGPAVAVACAGDERVAHHGTTIVLSQPRGSADGTADELTVQAQQHERQCARLRDLVATTTGRAPDDVGADLRTGRVLSAEEAQTYGLVDRLR